MDEGREGVSSKVEFQVGSHSSLRETTKFDVETRKPGY